MKKIVFQQESNGFKRKAASITAKGLTAMLCAAMAVSPVMGYAAQKSNDGYINIDGTAEKDKQGNFVTIAVIDKDIAFKNLDWKSLNGSEFVYYGETEIDSKKEYAFNFYLGDYTKNGVYKVYISSKTEDIKTDEIRYVNADALADALTQLKSKLLAGEDETAAFLKDTSNLKKLGVLCKFDGAETDAEIAAFAAKLLKKDDR